MFTDNLQITRNEAQGSHAKIRLGLVLDDQPSPCWIHELVRSLLGAEYAQLAVIVLRGMSHASSSQPQSIALPWWKKLDTWIFRENHDPLAPGPKCHGVPTVKLTSTDDKGKSSLSAADAAQIRACNLDILIELGSGDLPDGILDCVKHGIWVFQYAEYGAVKNELALFWNMFAGNRTCELLLQSLAADPLQDRVLYRGILAHDVISLYRNLVLDAHRRSEILLRCLAQVWQQGWDRIGIGETRSRISPARTGNLAISGVMPHFLVCWFRRSLQRLWTRVCFRQQWFLAFGESGLPDDTEQTRFNPVSLVMHPRGRNYADPFLFERDGRRYLFCEEYGDGPGTICCAEFQSDGSLSEPQPILTRNYHLSYPTVFEWRGGVYLLPETQENKTVEIYAPIDFPRRWELAAVLLNDFAATDPTIFEHNGKLWLFAAGGAVGTESSELFLFFADSLFGPWKPHPRNPIVCDVRRARPAGSLFFQGDRLIRPGQDCSERYGYAISLNRVEELSETDYREVPVGAILPNWMDGICATHTVNQIGGVTVLDGRALVPRFPIFNPHPWAGALKRNNLCGLLPVMLPFRDRISGIRMRTRT